MDSLLIHLPITNDPSGNRHTHCPSHPVQQLTVIKARTTTCHNATIMLRGFATAGQRRCGKVVFSVVSVCSWGKGALHVTATHWSVSEAHHVMK